MLAELTSLIDELGVAIKNEDNATAQKKNKEIETLFATRLDTIDSQEDYNKLEKLVERYNQQLLLVINNKALVKQRLSEFNKNLKNIKKYQNV
ncbi:hypothetical protein [Pseudoalteromonas mariniglutinosa]|uniref:hypothetical protein n=1 Tax=Pseudoalteromonas mariniglutinosa TaxID=206042 RepID=UPI00384C01CB